MRIGYPCINRSIGCSANRTFRLANFSEKRLIETAAGNVECLERILAQNVEKGLLFHRISSDIIPFASHPVCTVNWQHRFSSDFSRLGRFVRRHRMRISMHPDQFTLINSTDREVFERSVRELAYHADILDRMDLDGRARIQIHVGGIYGDKDAAMARFIRRFEELDGRIRQRLAIENDDRLYTFSDCVKIWERIGIPVIFDNLHHAVNSSGEGLAEVFGRLVQIWTPETGIPMTDYSDAVSGGRAGRHAEHIDAAAFSRYLADTEGFDFDIMLELKDKERSAAEAVRIAGKDARFISTGGPRKAP